MTYYKHMYFHLFNAITDALESIDLENPEYAKTILIQAQQDTEDMYIEARAEEEDISSFLRVGAAKALKLPEAWYPDREQKAE